MCGEARQIARVKTSQRGLLGASVTSTDASKQPGNRQVKNRSFFALRPPKLRRFANPQTTHFQELISQFKTPRSRQRAGFWHSTFCPPNTRQPSLSACGFQAVQGTIWNLASGSRSRLLGAWHGYRGSRASLRPSPDISIRLLGLSEVNADRPVVPAPSDRPSGAAFQVPIRLPLPTEGVVQAKPAAGDVAAVTIHLPRQRRPFCRVPGGAYRCRFCQALCALGSDRPK